MHILIGIILVVLVVWGVVWVSVTALAYVGYFLAMPSLVVMRLLEGLGLTSPSWSLLLHAALGGFLGYWAHLARPRRVKVLLACAVIGLYVFAIFVFLKLP